MNSDVTWSFGDRRTIALPYPPSVNRIWRVGRDKRVYLDKKYKAWRKEADVMILSQRRSFGLMIEGYFHAFITIDERKRRKNTDVDNRKKVVMDALQRMRVIENDANANSVTISWGPVDGASVTIFPAKEF